MSSATSTELAEPLPISVSATDDSNRYQFSETECVSVGDGSFYCSQLTSSGETVANGVFTQFDSDGDREIYFRDGGSVIQLTDNQLEDAAPFYDEAAQEVVFHRLTDGRYQIVRYDLARKTETQLTSTRENNMEPNQDRGIVVWQRWVGDNWEIALFDGDDISIITDNDYHDVAPVVHNGYIMWHTTSSQGEKLLSVYEIATGQHSTVADPDGGHVENPRFVLVYDTAYENGDRITKQYDPETGAVTPVGSEPAPLPVSVPEPDTTGETRALISTKTSGRESEESTDFNLSSSTPDVTGPDPVATTTVAATSTPPAESPADLDLRASTTEAVDLTEFDLVIPPRASTTAATSSGAGA